MVILVIMAIKSNKNPIDMKANAKDVIIACDFGSTDACLSFLDKFKDVERKPFLKIGMELYYAAGPEIVKSLSGEDLRFSLTSSFTTSPIR